MQIYDLHVHTNGGAPDAFVEQLAAAGVYGAAVFSSEPVYGGLSYERRVEAVLNFCADYPNRLFPVYWIHPFENRAAENAIDAAARGIAGFKIICNNFFVSDPASMELLRVIAELGKPVCFHSGILWDGEVSGQYNRPLNWECLLTIPKLKFSMGHCSWPWYDECIALYGKFQNAFAKRNNACEMFFDLTPGTPVPYRRDLLAKLFTVGYDVKRNIMFGTDCETDYNSEWSKKWQGIDNGIYADLGLDEETRKCVYHDNFLRFFGVSGEEYKKAALTCDGR
ncbi:MAG: amidohydrolase [Defluviitaleaceae bacterium]|nr:amidohydrolase [Defluviitaleaceae bacterium]